MQPLPMINRQTAQRLFTLLLLAVLCLPHAGSAASVTSPMPVPMPRLEAGEVTYFVQWEIKASGSATYTGNMGDKHSEQEIISQRGSAYVRPQFGLGGWAEVSNNELYVNTSYSRVSQYPCQTSSRYRMWISDPGRYVGAGPAPNTPNPHNVLFPYPEQEPDGSWIMQEPLDLTQQRHAFTHLTTLSATSGTCPGAAGSRAQESTFQSATGPGPFGPKILRADPNGKYFTMVHTYEDDGLGEIKLAVTRTVFVTRIDRCGGKAGPVDANDPVVKDINIALRTDTPDFHPDGTASVRAYVTCEGVPVKNARLEIGSAVQDKSGGHQHTAGRPRGYINGTKMSLASIPPPAAILTTDDRGTVLFTFEAGRDTKNERYGIAGTYTVWVRSATHDAYEELELRARVPDLRPLRVIGPFHFAFGAITPDHPQGYWGTAATLREVEDIASTFRGLQEEYNIDRRGKAPEWPLAKLYVNDISLHDGGLFDVRGWDNQAGGVRGAPWQPPHYGHRDGTDVDFDTRDWLDEDWVKELPAAQQREVYTTLRAALRLIGQFRGTWAPGPTMTLRVGQTRLSGLQAAATGPDAATILFMDDPAEQPVAAPGHTVTYTIGAHNYFGDAAAENVQLKALLPAGLTFQSATPAPTTTTNGQPTWQFGSLKTGGLPQLVTLVAHVEPTVSAGTVLTVTSEVTTSGPDAESANNRDAAAGLVIRPLGQDLAVHTDLDALDLTPGVPVTFTIDVDNLGTAAAAGSTLRITLPASVTLQRATPMMSTVENGQLVWNLGSLAPHATRMITASVLADSGLAAQIPLDDAVARPMLTTTFAVAATTGDLDASNNQQQVASPLVPAGSDLRVGLLAGGTALDGGLVAGQEMTYTLRYGNYGNQIASTSVVTLSLPSGLSVVSAEPQVSRTMTSKSFAGGVVGWDLGALDAGAEGAIVVRVKVTTVPAGGALVMATASTKTADIQPSNNIATDRRDAATSAPVLRYRVLLPYVGR